MLANAMAHSRNPNLVGLAMASYQESLGEGRNDSSN